MIKYCCWNNRQITLADIINSATNAACMYMEYQPQFQMNVMNNV